jgi:hypothetical protein
MTEELNRRLAGIRERVAYKRKLEASLAAARAALAYHRARLPALDSAMRKEYRDVERLEGAGPRALIASVFGSREEALERERREYLAASLQHHECTHAIATCEADVAELELSLETLGDVESLYVATLDEKERFLATGSDARAYRLARIAEELGLLAFHAREARGAIDAGEAALEALEAVAEVLPGLFGQSTTMVGDIFVSEVRINPFRLAELVEAADAARDGLRTFKRELADLGIRAKLKLDLGLELDELSARSRALFGSYYVRSQAGAQLESAREEVDAISDKVQRLVDDVEAGLSTVNKGIADLNTERLRILES